jgi:hypothetical protein
MEIVRVNNGLLTIEVIPTNTSPRDSPPGAVVYTVSDRVSE